MTIRQKLQLIQKISGLTQEKLAGQMGVSFPTFNSWINGRSLPRRNARERIDALYREYTGQKVVPDNVLRAKKQIIARKSRQSKNILRQILKQPDLADQFVLSLTYHTNRIEGKGGGLWTETVHYGPFHIDTTEPSTDISPATPDGDSGWFKTGTGLTLTPDESATTFYAWNGGATVRSLIIRHTTSNATRVRRRIIRMTKHRLSLININATNEGSMV